MKTGRIGDVQVDDDTLFAAMEEAHAQAAAEQRRGPMFLWIVILCIAAWFGARQTSDRLALIIAGIVIGAGVLVSIVANLLAGSNRRDLHLRRALNRRGFNLCVNCGYDVRGLSDDVKECPECGAAREAMPEQSP